MNFEEGAQFIRHLEQRMKMSSEFSIADYNNLVSEPFEKTLKFALKT